VCFCFGVRVSNRVHAGGERADGLRGDEQGTKEGHAARALARSTRAAAGRPCKLWARNQSRCSRKGQWRHRSTAWAAKVQSSQGATVAGGEGQQEPPSMGETRVTMVGRPVCSMAGDAYKERSLRAARGGRLLTSMRPSSLKDLALGTMSVRSSWLGAWRDRASPTPCRVQAGAAPLPGVRGRVCVVRCCMHMRTSKRHVACVRLCAHALYVRVHVGHLRAHACACMPQGGSKQRHAGRTRCQPGTRAPTGMWVHKTLTQTLSQPTPTGMWCVCMTLTLTLTPDPNPYLPTCRCASP